MFFFYNCDNTLSQNKFVNNHITTHHTKNISDDKMLVCQMCKAEFKDENDIEWHWYKCEHFCNNCQICVEERDENHTTHTFEETKIDRSFNRQ